MYALVKQFNTLYRLDTLLECDSLEEHPVQRGAVWTSLARLRLFVLSNQVERLSSSEGLSTKKTHPPRRGKTCAPKAMPISEMQIEIHIEEKQETDKDDACKKIEAVVEYKDRPLVYTRWQ